MPLTFLVGGARSGKSAVAVRAAAAQSAPVVFVATAEARDDEMSARIAGHRAERPRDWATVEEPRELARSISSAAQDAFVIVDCLTLWVTNVFDAGEDEVIRRATEAAAAAAMRSAPTLVISNEVGSGIVPLDASTRQWRDLLGRVNAVFAEHSRAAWLVVAGRVVSLHDAEVLGGD